MQKYDVDLIGDKSANRLIRHRIFEKLSCSFQQELVRNLDDYYPNIEQIFDKYVDVIRTISLRQSKYSDQSNVNAPKQFPNNQ